MTVNQLAYWNLEETKRSNAAKEAETNRSNLAKELETHRSNVADETETKRANEAREAEQHRSNVAKELENYRSNTTREAEEHRSNLADEAIAASQTDARWWGDWSKYVKLIRDGHNVGKDLYRALGLEDLFKQDSVPDITMDPSVIKQETELATKHASGLEGRKEIEALIDAGRIPRLISLPQYGPDGDISGFDIQLGPPSNLTKEELDAIVHPPNKIWDSNDLKGKFTPIGN